MPILENINVIDTKRDIAIGIDLPLTADYGSRFKLNYITLDQASANARNLLLTKQGERVMLPNFGCNLYGLLFEQITEDLIDELKLRVKAQFDYWLPYIFINTFEIRGVSVEEKQSLRNQSLNKQETEQLISQAWDKNSLYVYMIISLKNNKFDTKTIALEITSTN